jgi:hypothetical protein
MSRHYKIFKTSSSPSTGKALLNHTIFSPSQTGETVPLLLMSGQNHKHEAQTSTTGFHGIAEAKNNFAMRSLLLKFFQCLCKKTFCRKKHYKLTWLTSFRQAKSFFLIWRSTFLYKFYILSILIKLNHIS